MAQIQNQNLKKYSVAFKKMKAYEAICNGLKKNALAELSKAPSGNIVGGVEFYKSTNVTCEYPESVKKKIAKIRAKAVSDGLCKITKTRTLNAKIPKSTVKTLLAKSVPEYKKYCRIAA